MKLCVLYKSYLQLWELLIYSHLGDGQWTDCKLFSMFLKRSLCMRHQTYKNSIILAKRKERTAGT